MSTATKENAFETAIVRHLVMHGNYVEGDSRSFSKELAFDKGAVLAFLQRTQPQAWQKLAGIHGQSVEAKLTQRLFKELDNRGMLDVLRHGIIDYGVRFQLAYFKPASSLNPDAMERYRQNVLSVTRQLHYSVKESRKSVDLLLSLNGLPVATVELKNQFTGQNVSNAKRQYSQDRDPRELLFRFKKRALVHFAVDTDEAYMTTRLDGKNTRYLPFNRGHEGGAGNPQNEGKHRTAYLWEEVWAKDSWLDIIGKFLHLERRDLTVDGRTVRRESLIFPRYHQLDAVRKLSGDAERQGAGQHYLVQHSAGSGKSNSIAWLAYRLSSLYNDRDERVFDSVVVITDRRVLDKQLQDTIYQFEHKQGVVQRIDKGSKQLAETLASGSHIIITTLQKFPFAEVLDEVGTMPERTYAVIVDEAHSSQGGEASKSMKSVLGVSEEVDAGEVDDTEDAVREAMRSRGRQANLSFFAFTATPKQKTLQAFGVPDAKGEYRPFHHYSMRQAVEEGFIMDVLRNYTTYKSYYRLSKAIEDDPKLNKKQAAKAIARSVSFLPGVLTQKTEVIIEHFRQCVMHKIGGKAKAMVVTSSRPHVVRYKEEFDNYLQEQGYTDIRALVAFTAFTDPETDISYSERDLNGFGEGELPERFASEAYQLLLVADKYQTGFDQPLLHTMYVDKKLSGVRAVQTLSRLNRTHPGKEDTFVLDFANSEEEILAAFKPFLRRDNPRERRGP